MANFGGPYMGCQSGDRSPCTTVYRKPSGRPVRSNRRDLVFFVGSSHHFGSLDIRHSPLPATFNRHLPISVSQICFTDSKGMNWIQHNIYLYNVTFGLYMLDWWEHCLFNILMIVLLWFICFNGLSFMTEVYRNSLKAKIADGKSFAS